MESQEIEELFGRIRVWIRGSERAPHKPLLLLYALAKCLRSEPRLIPYTEIDDVLGQLLREFGPSRKSYHTEYPFWRLQNDGVWEIPGSEMLETRKENTDAKKSELVRYKVAGGFTEPIYEKFYRNPQLLSRTAQKLLDESFPESLHSDILTAVGLDLAPSLSFRNKRDPKFRSRILTIYEHRCAICSFDVRLDSVQIGLEAAHIKWRQAGGPDVETNGIALCVLHHKLFDRGAFTISPVHQLVLSERLHGTIGFGELLLAFHGKPVRTPSNPDYHPAEHFLSWHRHEVFREPKRWLP